jgi:hypothetical protein
MDRIDKVLLLLPLLPAADLLSTLFSLSLGGQEVGVLARPILEHYGPSGLVMLAAFASTIFLFFMEVVVYIKKLFTSEFRLRCIWYVLSISIYWLFVVEGVYVSTVVTNFLVPVVPALTQGIAFRGMFVGVYFAGVSALTLPQMKELPRF